MRSGKPSPPRWARAFLSWYCRPELVEDLEGDLNEYFERNCTRRGPRHARFIYAIDTLRFIRSYTIRRPRLIQYLINWLMIGSYLKTSGRNIARAKLFSLINIAGLAISMSVGLLLISLLTDMAAYDKYNKNFDRIYRVTCNRGDENDYASTSLRAGKLIQEKIPGIESTALLKRDFTGDVRHGEKTIPLTGFWANQETLEVFTFPLIAGNPATALKEPYSLVLTRTAAERLFGQADAVGKTVTFNAAGQPHKGDAGANPGDSYVVTAIVEDVPKFSHFSFEMLASLSTIDKPANERSDQQEWEFMWDNYTYLLLPQETDLTSLQANLSVLAEEQNKMLERNHIQLKLQPLGDIALGEDLNNSIGNTMGKGDVWMIGVLAIVVILSACFNYTNLSIAKALSRAREVGVRKVIGAMKGHVLAQFIVEAVVISMLALVFAFLIFLSLKPYFLSISTDLSEMLSLSISPRLIISFVATAVVVGIAAGFVPALFYSRLNAAGVLKANVTVQGFRRVNMRKALIVIQYTISVVFIAATLIGIRQYKHFISFDLGYNTDNIFNIKLQGNKASLLATELSSLPEVKGVSQSVIVTSIGNNWNTKVKYKDPTDSTWVNYNGIDENYMPLHDHQLITGKNFIARAETNTEGEVIVSQKILTRFNVAGGDPLKALDEILLIDNKEMRIIGVMKDFQYGKVDSGTEGAVFRYQPNRARFVNVLINTSDWPATLARIEQVWRKIDPVHQLDGMFYNDQIKQSYRGLSGMLKIVGFLSFLAICISSMGLLGMVVFSTESRLKEVSIRKVMGAPEWKLIFLLGVGFLKLLLISILIGLPTTYLFFDKLALSEIANPAPIHIGELLLGMLAILLVAFAMIGGQTLKVARTNPAEVLRTE